MTNGRRPLWRDPWLLGYAALYVVLLLALHLREGFGLGEPLLVLGIVGVAFSALAWWSTRGASRHAVPVREARAECGLLAAYLVLVVVPFLAMGGGFVRRSVTNPRSLEVALLALKLAIFVAVPFALLRNRFRYSWRDFVDTYGRWDGHGRAVVVMALALVSFQALFGQGLAHLKGAAVGPTPLATGVLLAFLWLVFEVGLVEEFFFRALVQSRVAALLGSEVAGVVLMSLVFGLAHAPGMYLRPAVTQEALGSAPSLLGAIGYSVVITSVTGFFLGILWARTRNLVSLMLIHAAGDLVPNLVPFLRTWGFVASVS